MQVTILNPNEVSNLFNSWGTFSCTCYDTPKKFANGVGKSCLSSKHFSGSRADYIKFDISGVSRACLDQLARHSVGTAINMQSGRYVKADNFDYHVPPLLNKSAKALELYHKHMEVTRETYKAISEELESLGYKGEKVNEVARGVLPMNHHSKISMGFTIESFINLCHKRLCVCSQHEIRQLVRLMRNEVVKLVPELDKHLVAVCEAYNYCPESPKRTCGAYPQLEVVSDLVAKWKSENKIFDK